MIDDDGCQTTDLDYTDIDCNTFHFSTRTPHTFQTIQIFTLIPLHSI